MTIRHLAKKKGKRKWQLDCGKVGGKRKQLFFLTEKQARNALAVQENERHELGQSWADLPGRTRLQVVGVLDEMKKAGTTFTEVWADWQKAAHIKPATRINLRDAAVKLIEHKRVMNRRESYIRILRQTVTRFIEGQQERYLDEVSRTEILSWLAAQKVSPKTYKNNAGLMQALFAWGKEAGYLVTNPTEELPLPTIEETEIRILSNPEVIKMMTYLRQSDPEFLAYVAIATFAGTRPQEIAKLQWQDLDLEDGVLKVNAKASKVRERRVTHLHKTAIAWLKLCRPGEPLDPIAPPDWQDRLVTLRGVLAFDAWPRDVLRHTAATHLLNELGSADQVALELGTSKQKLWRNYRAVVQKRISAEFFQILPESLPADVLAFPAPGSA